MLLAKRQVNSATLKAETCTFLLMMVEKRLQQARLGWPTKTINDNSLSIADRHAQVSEGIYDEAHIRQHLGNVIR